jgi:hypothetical protein
MLTIIVLAAIGLLAAQVMLGAATDRADRVFVSIIMFFVSGVIFGGIANVLIDAVLPRAWHEVQRYHVMGYEVGAGPDSDHVVRPWVTFGAEIHPGGMEELQFFRGHWEWQAGPRPILIRTRREPKESWYWLLAFDFQDTKHGWCVVLPQEAIDKADSDYRAQVAKKYPQLFMEGR